MEVAGRGGEKMDETDATPPGGSSLLPLQPLPLALPRRVSLGVGLFACVPLGSRCRACCVLTREGGSATLLPLLLLWR